MVAPRQLDKAVVVVVVVVVDVVIVVVVVVQEESPWPELWLGQTEARKLVFELW